MAQMVIVDQSGRVVDVKRNISVNSSLQIGEKYNKWIGIENVIQENQKASVKLVKLAD